MERRIDRRLLFFGRYFLEVLIMKRNFAANDFLERHPRRFVFGGIDVDARARTTLQLFAAFGRKDN